jgi:glycosyltransferase involved in cell wall biosynthesis
MPRVSVVLPFRDAADTLDDALRSIAAQTMPDFECLLIDNGSLDASADVARAAAIRDVRFRALRVDGGLVQALNAGIAAAQSALIARMDADDLAHPTRLERQLCALDDDPTLAVSSCLVRCFPEETLPGGMRRYEAWLNALRTPDEIRDALFIESPIAHPSAVIRRAALDAVGGYRETGGPEDYDLWLRLLLGGHRAGKVGEVLLQWRDSTQRLSRVDPRCDRRRFFATKVEHFPSAVPRRRSLQIWGAGRTGRRWARALQQADYVVDSFVDAHAQRWGRSVRGVPVRPPQPAQRGTAFILVATGTPGAREEIEAMLHQSGLRPWRDYLAVA